MKEITSINPRVDGSNIHNLDDPELYKFPIAYLSEPGYWVMNDAEAKGLREYLLKVASSLWTTSWGGEWLNFEEQMLRVLPGAQIVPMDVSHPVFDSFFHLESLAMTYPNRPSIQAEFHGIFEDNDPDEAVDGDHQLQQRHRRLHGVVER